MQLDTSRAKPEPPAITEPELLLRLRLNGEQLAEFFRTLAARLGRRTYTPEAYAHAIGYPWSPPSRSYLLTGGEVEHLRRDAGDSVPEPRHDRSCRRPVGHPAPVHPAAALALGADAGAEMLVRQVFESFSDLMPRLERTVRRRGQRFSSPVWTSTPSPAER